jgi:hypothetical protein
MPAMIDGKDGILLNKFCVHREKVDVCVAGPAVK